MSQPEREVDVEAETEAQILHDSSEQSDSEDEPEEAMVLSRARRTNAGNRMSNLLALAEAEDDETRVIYGDDTWQETADDMEFGGVEAEAPDDVSLESSSDDDEDDQDDDEAGEKEVKRQERTENTKKRKQIANPFADAARKKARLNAAPKVFTHAPRPKKKSERDSWLPTPDEGPTRASSRKQTMKNKKDTHARLVLKEKTRERVVELMQAANRRKEAFKPLSQAEKLAMAAKIEKENSKSLNRWEESENRRAAEQQARLDALRNRQIEGPYIRYWSGPAVWRDEKLVFTGKKARIVQELDGAGLSVSVSRDKPREEPKRPILSDIPPSQPHSTEQIDSQLPQQMATIDDTQRTLPTKDQKHDSLPLVPGLNTQEISTQPLPTSQAAQEDSVPQFLSEVKNAVRSTNPDNSASQQIPTKPESQHTLTEPESQHTLTESEPQSVRQPEPRLALPPENKEKPQRGTSQVADELSKPPQALVDVSKVTPAVSDTEMSGVDTQPAANPQHSIPMPSTVMFAPPGGLLDGILDWASYHNQIDPSPGLATTGAPRPPPPASQPSQQQLPITSQPSGTFVLPSAPIIPPIPLHTPPAPPPVISRATRNLVMLSHYETLTPSQKEHIYKILTAPCAKPSRYLTKRVDKSNYPAPVLCAITANVARYRDPVTGLAYRDRYAYACIQRLVGGSCAWSAGLEAFVGVRGTGARGVPERFWNNMPKKAEPSKEKEKEANTRKTDNIPGDVTVKSEEGATGVA